MNLLKRLLNISKKPHLTVFRGFGSRHQFRITGRVTESFQKKNLKDEPGMWTNALTLLRRYLAGPKTGKKVEIKFNGKTIAETTDSNGFFEHVFAPDEISLPGESEWIYVPVHLPTTGENVKAPVLLEGRGNTYGIISDIDDTVLISKATQKLKFLYLLLTKNAHSRTPFPAVVPFYNALVAGSDGESSNPIFYVSSSHWNIYNFLTAFMEVNDVPIGPLLLRKFKSFLGMIKNATNHQHKKEKITRILETYPHLPFVLIGDSGQKDPEIYSEIAAENPEQIEAIYIRNLRGKAAEALKKRIDTLHDTDVVYAKTSSEAADHARDAGLITDKHHGDVSKEVGEK